MRCTLSAKTRGPKPVKSKPCSHPSSSNCLMRLSEKMACFSFPTPKSRREGDSAGGDASGVILLCQKRSGGQVREGKAMTGNGCELGGECGRDDFHVVRFFILQFFAVPNSSNEI